MDAWRKRIKKYAFSNKNGLVWRGKNKRLCGGKYFASPVFFETKTNTFKNALVWSRLEDSHFCSAKQLFHTGHNYSNRFFVFQDSHSCEDRSTLHRTNYPRVRRFEECCSGEITDP